MQDPVLETTAVEVRAEQDLELHSVVDSLEPPSMTDTQEDDALSGAAEVTVKTEEPDTVTRYLSIFTNYQKDKITGKVICCRI